MKKDLIIGCYTNYTWDKIKFWANSIGQSGFTGDKAVIVYNSDASTVKKLTDNNFKVFGFNTDAATGNLYFKGQFTIVVRRFLDLCDNLSKIDLTQYRYIITSDVKDVIFQTNPSDWLTENMGNEKILASCESIQYQNEPWGKDNLEKSFPLEYNTLKDKPIWNCGVQAGDPNTMLGLWLSIYTKCMGNPIYNPDQAAYNILLNSETYSNITKFAMSESAWAAQLGTTMDPTKIKNFLPNLLEAPPIFKDGYVCTSTGIKHSIVHQYDRVPICCKVIQDRYS